MPWIHCNHPFLFPATPVCPRKLQTLHLHSTMYVRIWQQPTQNIWVYLFMILTAKKKNILELNRKKFIRTWKIYFMLAERSTNRLTKCTSSWLHFFFFVNVPAICLLFILATTCFHFIVRSLLLRNRKLKKFHLIYSFNILIYLTCQFELILKETCFQWRAPEINSYTLCVIFTHGLSMKSNSISNVLVASCKHTFPSKLENFTSSWDKVQCCQDIWFFTFTFFLSQSKSTPLLHSCP